MDAIDELIEYRKPHGLSPMLRRVHRFHKTNPQVLDFLVQELRDVKESGRTRASLGSLWHYARWVLTEKHRAPGESFAMSNNLFPYYGRIIVILHPALNGFFVMNKSKADEDLGTMLEPIPEPYPLLWKEGKGGRNLLWADGKTIGSEFAMGNGWRPSTPHEPKPVRRRERVRRAA